MNKILNTIFKKLKNIAYYGNPFKTGSSDIVKLFVHVMGLTFYLMIVPILILIELVKLGIGLIKQKPSNETLSEK